MCGLARGESMARVGFDAHAAPRAATCHEERRRALRFRLATPMAVRLHPSDPAHAPQKPSAGVDSSGRRKWDVEAYAVRDSDSIVRADFLAEEEG